MKKLMIIATMFIANAAFTNNEIGEPQKVLTHDSVNNNVQFEVEKINSNLLNVWVEGAEGNFVSISLIDQRGKSIFYQFVESQKNHFSIDLANLSEGKYYVKLNMGSEIRMKVVMVQK
ncbi:T9SS type A sorting domain-containing protein [Brumimicrobium sp.]|uniref:T9SS type A sorting domain-containing protein n=1 Tax=Brumimicrobium sp. TaxID=2029867 RepID=UPI0026184A25|nr:T9SS type A sorting domain-containing protein [uncultured Brumimicrobium sp.]